MTTTAAKSLFSSDTTILEIQEVVYWRKLPGEEKI